MKTKFIIGSTILLAASFTTPAFAAEGYDVSVSVDAVSEYIFRGAKLGDSSIQPGVEVAIGDLAFGVWGSTGVGKRSILNADEIDIYGSYGFALGEKVSASVGATLYHYPQLGGVFDIGDNLSGFDDASTFELSAGAEFDYPLAPSVTAYYDVVLEAFTLEGGIGHTFETEGKTSLDVGLTAGLVEADGGGDYEYGLASAAVNYAITDDAGVYVGANYSISSENTLGLVNAADDSFWFGAGISNTF